MVAFSWDAPDDDGGEVVIDYEVWMETGDTFENIASYLTETSYEYKTGITAGATYSFKVRARNSVGFSEYSPVLPIIAATTPKASPADLASDNLKTTETTVPLTWKALSVDKDGGSPIIDYSVEQKNMTTGNYTVVESGIT